MKSKLFFMSLLSLAIMTAWSTGCRNAGSRLGCDGGSCGAFSGPAAQVQNGQTNANYYQPTQNYPASSGASQGYSPNFAPSSGSGTREPAGSGSR